jgi:hypothetical protein
MVCFGIVHQEKSGNPGARATGAILTMVSGSWDRCYDFKNIFAEQFGEKMGVFWFKMLSVLQNLDPDIGF